VGHEAAVDRAAKRLGTIVRPLDVTDFVAVGLAIFLGAALGASMYLTVGGTKVFLGTSVGTLLAGVVTGYIRSVRPLFAGCRTRRCRSCNPSGCPVCRDGGVGGRT